MNFELFVVLYGDIMAANCTSSNCTAAEVDTEEFEFTGPMVTGIGVSSILVTIILLSICYAKKWCCFMVRYKLQTEISSSIRFNFSDKRVTGSKRVQYQTDDEII